MPTPFDVDSADEGAGHVPELSTELRWILGKNALMPTDMASRFASYSRAEQLEFLQKCPLLERLLRSSNPKGPRNPTLAQITQDDPRSRLITTLDSVESIVARTRTLEIEPLQLLYTAVWMGGTITTTQLEAQLVGVTDKGIAMQRLADAAEVLRFLLLAKPTAIAQPTDKAKPTNNAKPTGNDRSTVISSTGPSSKSTDANRPAPFISLYREVTSVVRLAGQSFVDAEFSLSSEQLRLWCVANQIKSGNSKAERSAALMAAFTSPEWIQRIESGLTSVARQIVQILAANLDPLPLERFTEPGFRYSYGRRATTDQETAILELHRIGILQIDFADGWVCLWREVSRHFRSSYIARWQFQTEQPIAIPGSSESGLIRTAETFQAIHRHWVNEPPTALADGGLGVGPVRAAAKRLGLPAGTVGFFTHLLVGEQLLTLSIAGTTGRGRNKAPVFAWSTSAMPTTHPAELWTLAVSRWLECRTIEDGPELPERYPRGGGSYHDTTPRHLALRVLEGLPQDQAIATDNDFAAFLYKRLPNFFTPNSSIHLLLALRAVGLVPATGPVALTKQARALLAGEILGQPAPNESGQASLIVQGDQTIMAPPETPYEILALLAQIAELEVDGAVRMYRLSTTRIHAALGEAHTAESIIEQLAANSKVGVPQSVEYFIRDVERRRGQLVVASASTVISSDDPALLVQAVNVKAAGLRLISSHTAVSDLPAKKVHQALISKGLLPVLSSDSDPSRPNKRSSTSSGSPQRGGKRPSDPEVSSTDRILPYNSVTKVGNFLTEKQEIN